MRSRHADRFNHDTEVDGYDDDVADESNPIRNGYGATLDWVIERVGFERWHAQQTGTLSWGLAACRPA
jgi:hypothetical protein